MTSRCGGPRGKVARALNGLVDGRVEVIHRSTEGPNRGTLTGSLTRHYDNGRHGFYVGSTQIYVRNVIAIEGSNITYNPNYSGGRK